MSNHYTTSVDPARSWLDTTTRWVLRRETLPWHQLPAPMKRAWCVAVRAVRLHDLGKAEGAQAETPHPAHR